MQNSIQNLGGFGIDFGFVATRQNRIPFRCIPDTSSSSVAWNVLLVGTSSCQYHPHFPKLAQWYLFWERREREVENREEEQDKQKRSKKLTSRVSKQDSLTDLPNLKARTHPSSTGLEGGTRCGTIRFRSCNIVIDQCVVIDQSCFFCTSTHSSTPISPGERRKVTTVGCLMTTTGSFGLLSTATATTSTA